MLKFNKTGEDEKKAKQHAEEYKKKWGDKPEYTGRMKVVEGLQAAVQDNEIFKDAEEFPDKLEDTTDEQYNDFQKWKKNKENDTIL